MNSGNDTHKCFFYKVLTVRGLFDIKMFLCEDLVLREVGSEKCLVIVAMDFYVLKCSNKSIITWKYHLFPTACASFQLAVFISSFYKNFEILP